MYLTPLSRPDSRTGFSGLRHEKEVHSDGYMGHMDPRPHGLPLVILAPCLPYPLRWAGLFLATAGGGGSRLSMITNCRACSAHRDDTTHCPGRNRACYSRPVTRREQNVPHDRSRTTGAERFRGTRPLCLMWQKGSLIRVSWRLTRSVREPSIYARRFRSCSHIHSLRILPKPSASCLPHLLNVDRPKRRW